MTLLNGLVAVLCFIGILSWVYRLRHGPIMWGIEDEEDEYTEDDVYYVLTVFDKESDSYRGEFILDVTPDEIRAAFGMQPDEPLWGCLPVGYGQVDWLDEQGFDVNLAKYDYFVEDQIGD